MIKPAQADNANCVPHLWIRFPEPAPAIQVSAPSLTSVTRGRASTLPAGLTRWQRAPRPWRDDRSPCNAKGCHRASEAGLLPERAEADAFVAGENAVFHSVGDTGNFVAEKALHVFTRSMNIDEDLHRIALQEQRLQFDHFNATTAWNLGNRLKEAAEARQAAIVIDIHSQGMPLFYVALEGTTPDNPDWVRRKRNIVTRFFRSSYAVGLMEKQQKVNLGALDLRDYAAHGGCFPILLLHTGFVGTITVSGLPQREDHCLVVQTVADFLERNISDIALA